MKAALQMRAAQLLKIEVMRDLTDDERTELVKLSDSLHAIDGGKLPSVMACSCGYVEPGHNRPLLSVLEWGRRESAARGWFAHFTAYTAADGRQAVNVYLLAFL